MIEVSCQVKLSENPDIDCRLEELKDAICQIPKGKSGLYFFYGGKNDQELLYIGKAGKLKERIADHLKKRKSSNTRKIAHNFKRVEVYYFDDLVLLDIAETFLINSLHPKLNSEKVWTYTSEKHAIEWLNEDDCMTEEQIRDIYLRVNL